MIGEEERPPKKASDPGSDELDSGSSPAPRRAHFRFKLSRFLAVVLVTGAVIGIELRLLSSPRQAWDFDHRFPPPPLNPTSGLADVAGEYYQGNGLGFNWRFAILDDGRYSFVWSGCLGVYERESGFVSKSNGLLILSPTESTRPSIPRVLQPIFWGPRVYLVPPDEEEMERFCLAIIKGEEPRNDVHGHFYLTGHSSPVGGVPALPEKWAKYLRENLLIGPVTEVLEDGRLKIDLGSEDGVHGGDVLAVQGCDRYLSRAVEIIRVEPRACVARESFHDGTQGALEPGRQVVTQRPPSSRGGEP